MNPQPSECEKGLITTRKVRLGLYSNKYLDFSMVELTCTVNKGKTVKRETPIIRILKQRSEVWQVRRKEINKLLPTEMDFLRRSAGMSVYAQN